MGSQYRPCLNSLFKELTRAGPTFTVRYKDQPGDVGAGPSLPPSRGPGNRVKTKKPQGSLSDLAVQIVFYLFADYTPTMPYARPFVKVFYALFIVVVLFEALKTRTILELTRYRI